MPEDFHDALIVALYMNKGSKADCGNYRDISLLSIAGTIFARIVLNRLIAVSEAYLPEAQCGFCPGCSTWYLHGHDIYSEAGSGEILPWAESQTGLCPRSCSVQPVLHLCPKAGSKEHGRGSICPLPLTWFHLWPSEAECYNKDPQ